MSEEVVKSFLVSLGFKIDQEQHKKFKEATGGSEKLLAGVAASATAAGVAIAAMVSQYATDMERLHYSSQRTKSSVNDLKSLEQAAEKVGLTSSRISDTIESLSSNLTYNMGAKGNLAKYIGVDPDTLTNTQSFMLLMEKLHEMKNKANAMNIADSFGIKQDVFTNINNNFEQFKKTYSASQQVNKTNNLDKFAEASTEYKNAWREIADKMESIGHSFAIDFLPAFKGIAKAIGDSLDYFKTLKGVGTGEAVKKIAKDASNSVADSVANFMINGFGGSGKQPAKATGSAIPAVKVPSDRGDKFSFLSNLESQMGLPKGLLSGIWGQESSFGKRKVGQVVKQKSGKVTQAMGDFQFNEDTAKDMGLTSSERMDFHKSAQAAAKYLKQLISRYKGNVALALGAYNSGMGNIDKRLKNAGGVASGAIALSTPETRNYVGDIMGGKKTGQPITTVNMNIYGEVTDQVMTKARRDMEQTSANIARNLRSNVQ